jgi:DNA-directed RNA polymerase specialized sigma24 family protein
MGALRELRSIGRSQLRILRGHVLELVPDETALLHQWDPMVQSFARTYGHARCSPEDLAQELRISLLQVAEKVNPTSRPKEFVRVLRTSLKNRCLDLLRSVKAQKRMAVVGRTLICQCGYESSWTKGMDPVCLMCGERGEVGHDTETMSWHFSRSSDMSLDSPSYEGKTAKRFQANTDLELTLADMLPGGLERSPIDSIASTEAVDTIRAKLIPYPDRALFNLKVNPPEEYTQFIQTHRRRSRMNLYKIPYWLMAKYMGLRSDKLVRLAHLRICVVVADVIGRKDLLEDMNMQSLQQA